MRLRNAHRSCGLKAYIVGLTQTGSLFKTLRALPSNSRGLYAGDLPMKWKTASITPAISPYKPQQAWGHSSVLPRLCCTNRINKFLEDYSVHTHQNSPSLNPDSSQKNNRKGDCLSTLFYFESSFIISTSFFYEALRRPPFSFSKTTTVRPFPTFVGTI